MYSASLVASTVCGCEIPDMETLKAFVRRRRNEMGLSQAAFAKLAGVEAHTVWQIEKGATKSPKSGTVQGLARALAISPEQVVLMLRDENMQAADDHELLRDGETKLLVALDPIGRDFVARYKASGMSLKDFNEKFGGVRVRADAPPAVIGYFEIITAREKAVVDALAEIEGWMKNVQANTAKEAPAERGKHMRKLREGIEAGKKMLADIRRPDYRPQVGDKNRVRGSKTVYLHDRDGHPMAPTILASFTVVVIAHGWPYFSTFTSASNHAQRASSFAQLSSTILNQFLGSFAISSFALMRF